MSSRGSTPICIDEAKLRHFACLKIANTECSAVGGLFSDVTSKSKFPLPGSLGGLIYGPCEAHQSKKCDDAFEDEEKECEKLKPAQP